MFNVIDSQTFRDNVREQIEKIVGNKKDSVNIEKGVFNVAIQLASQKNIVKKWENAYFTQIYTDRLRCVVINLTKNSDLLDNVKTHNIKPQDLAFMTHQKMSPDKWKELLYVKQVRDQNRYEPKIDANTDNFTCRKCKSKRCSYYQLQTRSADEPMTTFVTCIDCGSRWKC